ncbi:hypothetical protein RHSIM_Rhsim09G0172700 [Rhododendron simsii]|uniref:protein-serine/threonine phosphatase n=1 Tax=Rhododendron simsii TaxID=118357 RepID=A0A834LEX5_RHOSS|nr:hypothetical protein RHSIM_Rhsim09G0172700 [Rhododendron simsii]
MNLLMSTGYMDFLMNHECKHRFNVRIWKTFADCFYCLPVAALFDDRTFGDVKGWGMNDRGVSYTLGPDKVLWRTVMKLVTVFSAPNYCGEFDNAGALMSVDENLMCSFQILKPAEIDV